MAQEAFDVGGGGDIEASVAAFAVGAERDEIAGLPETTSKERGHFAVAHAVLAAYGGDDEEG